MSLEVATWVTAVATVLLAVGAGITAIFAYHALQKQSAEVKAIEQQVSDQKELTARQADQLDIQANLLRVQSEQFELQRRQFERDQADRRRAQASSIYFTIGRFSGYDADLSVLLESAPPDPSTYRNSVTVHVVNTSSLPVYDVVIGWRKGAAAWGDPEAADVLHPRDAQNFTRELPGALPPAVDLTLFGAVVRFRDAAGVHWLLRPDGGLTEEGAGQ